MKKGMMARSLTTRQHVARRDGCRGITRTRHVCSMKSAAFNGARILPRRRKPSPAQPSTRRVEYADQLGGRRWTYFHRILAALRSRCGPALPVAVRIGRVRADLYGYCSRASRGFVIRLSNQLKEPEAIDMLVHEWAHALAWNLQHDRLVSDPRITPDQFETATHGPDWGVAYSRAYVVRSEEIARLRRERNLARRTRT